SSCSTRCRTCRYPTDLSTGIEVSSILSGGNLSAKRRPSSDTTRSRTSSGTPFCSSSNQHQTLATRPNLAPAARVPSGGLRSRDAARGARDAHARARRPCVGAASARRLPRLPGLDPWNRRIDRLPVAADSNAIIASIGGSTGLHADFGSGLWDGAPIGLPIKVRGRSHTEVRVWLV